MAKKGSKSFKLSKKAHKRLFSIADHAPESYDSYKSYFYHGYCLQDMDEKKRTLTEVEKRDNYERAKLQARVSLYGK